MNATMVNTTMLRKVANAPTAKMISMRKAMSHSITLIMVLVVGLVIIGLLIIMVGDKLGRGSDAADDTVGISIDSMDCPVECSKCCSSGYGNEICSKNYMACDCTCD